MSEEDPAKARPDVIRIDIDRVHLGGPTGSVAVPARPRSRESEHPVVHLNDQDLQLWLMGHGPLPLCLSLYDGE